MNSKSVTKSGLVCVSVRYLKNRSTATDTHDDRKITFVQQPGLVLRRTGLITLCVCVRVGGHVYIMNNTNRVCNILLDTPRGHFINVN